MRGKAIEWHAGTKGPDTINGLQPKIEGRANATNNKKKNPDAVVTPK